MTEIELQIKQLLALREHRLSIQALKILASMSEDTRYHAAEPLRSTLPSEQELTLMSFVKTPQVYEEALKLAEFRTSHMSGA